MTKTLTYFQILAVALTTVGEVVNDAAENKVIILVYPATRTYDVCVLAFGKIVKSDTGSWPLPLEVHVIGMTQEEHMEWVKYILPSLYCIAQPDIGECRVYLPGDNVLYPGYASELFSVLAELGKMFSAQHRLYLPTCYNMPHNTKAAKEHKIALEFRYL